MIQSILNSILGGFTNPKTTVTGLVGAVVVLLHTFGVITITPEQKDAFIVVIITVMAWFTRDSDGESTGTKK